MIGSQMQLLYGFKIVSSTRSEDKITILDCFLISYPVRQSHIQIPEQKIALNMMKSMS